MEMCTNLNGQAVRWLGLDGRLALEVKTVNADDVRDVQAVAEDDVRMTGDALRWKPQHVRAILRLGQRKLIRRRLARPHPRQAPALEHRTAIESDLAIADRSAFDLSATDRARGADRIPAFADDAGIRESIHGVTSPNGDSSPRSERIAKPARKRVYETASTLRGNRPRSSLRRRGRL